MDVVLIQAITPILTVDDFGVAAIEIVLPAVEATHEMLGIAAALRQPSCAMRADVVVGLDRGRVGADDDDRLVDDRSEEHTSELQSLMRISYAVFCLKKK